MIAAIIAVGVSSLIKAGVETQISRKIQENMQTVALNIVDDLRQDIRMADRATVQNATTLVLAMPATPPARPTAYTLTYRLQGTDFVRIDSARGQKLYNDPSIFSPKLSVDCTDPLTGGANTCFSARMMNSDTPPEPRQIRVNAIRVYRPVPLNGGTVIDRAFGAPNFTVRQFAFDVMSAKEFE